MGKLKVALAVLATAATLVGAFVGWGYARSDRAVGRVYKIRGEPVAVPADEGSRLEGRRLFAARGCEECHGADGGGKAFMSGTPVGSYYGSNLTRGRGGLPTTYDDEAFARAVRHCVQPSGRPLVMMVCEDYRDMSDREVGQILAFVRSLPPVDRDNQPQQITLLARVLYATGKFKLVHAELIDHERQRPPAPEPGPTVEYGKYLVAACTGCHGDTLSGGPLPGMPPDMPPPSNLTPAPGSALATWTLDQFATAMRLGKRPDGRELNRFMPWPAFSRMNDVEVEALYRYLKTVPPRAYGGR